MYRLLLPLLLATSLLFTGMAHADEEAPTRTRIYRYVYYPDQQIYYATEQQIWFWPNGNTWRYGVHLPARLRAHIGTGLPVVLPTTRPFMEHAVVERDIGAPWRERQATRTDANDDLHDASGEPVRDEGESG